MTRLRRRLHWAKQTCLAGLQQLTCLCSTLRIEQRPRKTRRSIALRAYI
jgi:hypothetical protein